MNKILEWIGIALIPIVVVFMAVVFLFAVGLGIRNVTECKTIGTIDSIQSFSNGVLVATINGKQITSGWLCEGCLYYKTLPQVGQTIKQCTGEDGVIWITKFSYLEPVEK